MTIERAGVAVDRAAAKFVADETRGAFIAPGTALRAAAQHLYSLAVNLPYRNNTDTQKALLRDVTVLIIGDTRGEYAAIAQRLTTTGEPNPLCAATPHHHRIATMRRLLLLPHAARLWSVIPIWAVITVILLPGVSRR